MGTTDFMAPRHFLIGIPECPLAFAEGFPEAGERGLHFPQNKTTEVKTK